jgi:hypothetical protein
MKSGRRFREGSDTNIGDVMTLLQKWAESTDEIHGNHVWAACAPIEALTIQVGERSRTHYVISTEKSCRSSSPWRSKTLVSANGVIRRPEPPPFSSSLADSASPLGPVNGSLSALGSGDALRCRLLNSKCRSYLPFQNISPGISISLLLALTLLSLISIRPIFFIHFFVLNISSIQSYFPHFHSNIIVASSPTYISFTSLSFLR